MNTQSNDATEKALLANETRTTFGILLSVCIPLVVFVLSTELVQMRSAIAHDVYVVAIALVCALLWFALLIRTIPAWAKALYAVDLFYAEKRHIHAESCTHTGRVEIIDTQSYSYGGTWTGGGYSRLYFQRTKCLECDTVTVYKPPTEPTLEVLESR